MLYAVELLCVNDVLGRGLMLAASSVVSLWEFTLLSPMGLIRRKMSNVLHRSLVKTQKNGFLPIHHSICNSNSGMF